MTTWWAPAVVARWAGRADAHVVGAGAGGAVVGVATGSPVVVVRGGSVVAAVVDGVAIVVVTEVDVVEAAVVDEVVVAGDRSGPFAAWRAWGGPTSGCADGASHGDGRCRARQADDEHGGDGAEDASAAWGEAPDEAVTSTGPTVSHCHNSGPSAVRRCPRAVYRRRLCDPQRAEPRVEAGHRQTGHLARLVRPAQDDRIGAERLALEGPNLVRGHRPALVFETSRRSPRRAPVGTGDRSSPDTAWPAHAGRRARRSSRPGQDARRRPPRRRGPRPDRGAACGRCRGRVRPTAVPSRRGATRRRTSAVWRLWSSRSCGWPGVGVRS